MPTAWDGLSALLLTEVGVEALGTSSGAGALTLGRLDGRHAISRDEHIANARLRSNAGVLSRPRRYLSETAPHRRRISSYNSIIHLMPAANTPRLLFAKDLVGTITAARQHAEIQWRAGTLIVDEPVFNGGHDLGPDPFTLVLSGLVGCTLNTLRMYVRRKGWTITDITVTANLTQQPEPFRTTIFRKITIGNPVTEEQRDKLLNIAKHCPVARLLEGEIVIDTAMATEQ